MPWDQSSLDNLSVIVQFNSLQPHGLQHARLPCLLPYSRGCSNMSIESVMPSNHLILCRPLLFPSSIFPIIRVFSNESVLSSGGQSITVSASVFVLPMKFKTDFLQDWLVISPCSSRDTQESSPTPQFKTLVLSFLYSPTLTSIHDYWKNHSFD